MSLYDTREGARLAENRERTGHWNRWGPYLAERAWGTVREDYSANGNAWAYFPHDHARSRAYRWNEDGLGGISDRHQYLCFALALWNGRDPILKERMFGLAGSEGNHGEDVKDYWFYLDSTPTHSFMRYLYKYPHGEFPYARLLEENRRRGKEDPEFELVDTGIFDEGRYFDVEVVYAKAGPEDLLIRITATNRGAEAAPIDLLPTLWFRNTWRWGRDPYVPSITGQPPAGPGAGPLLAAHRALGDYVLFADGADERLFTENETNAGLLFGAPSATPYVKDAFHEAVVSGRREAVNPAETGTKAAFRWRRTVGAGESLEVRLRLAKRTGGRFLDAPFAEFDETLRTREEEADEFYAAVLPKNLPDDARLVARQAFAGMLWSKQYYHYVVTDWLEGDPAAPPPPPERLSGRNRDWSHLFLRDVVSMPDKWEFPWFASWDLGFHCVTLAHVDPQFAKEQILLMLREWTMHPNGQIAAYEWDFGDVNPPVLSLAAWAVFEIERRATGVADYDFLERVFQKMLLNFTWWVNRKDAGGRNVFQGGFLGMDNIGAFDRNDLPAGCLLGQADGTSWMAAFAKSLLTIALKLAERNPVYEDVASKFWEHFVYVANGLNSRSDPASSLWDEEDGFFYDHLLRPGEPPSPIRARSMVGFVPLFGASTVPAETFGRFPEFNRRREWFVAHRPELTQSVEPMVVPGPRGTLILGLVREDQLRRMLEKLLDESEFLSPHGVRSVSKHHESSPLVLEIDGREYRLDYEPGESRTGLFGGNSNWRGPVWVPVNWMIILALRNFHLYWGDTLQVECPTGSGRMTTLDKAAGEIARRVASIFLRDREGRRPVHGACRLFQQDPHWRDLIPFHEYFHGDDGRGCGASHQTGWTGLIAQILIELGEDAGPP
ncbi:MAG TPA: glucosidase [Thermoanaerobaculia bacterium]|nr:glucosidase [Thermoanaerobaculia bacterium]HQR67681.1 glucosidase [Thermoanaerobaculia bacterium]